MYKHNGTVLNPYQKPLTLMGKFIKAFTLPGDIIVDVTAGTCTTAVRPLNDGSAYSFISHLPPLKLACDAVLQLAAAFCYVFECNKYMDREYPPRRVLLFENDEHQFEGGHSRLRKHRDVFTLGPPEGEVIQHTIRPHFFIPPMDDDDDEDEDEDEDEDDEDEGEMGP